MSASIRIVLVLVALTGLLIGPVSPALAHTSLLASSPPNGERLAYSPDELVLTFATEIDPQTVQATLQASDGSQVDLILLSDEVAPTSVIAYGVPRLPHEVYGLTWQSVGPDGHRASGEVLFGVGVAVDPGATVGSDGGTGAAVQDGASLVLRIAWYVVLTLLAGAFVLGSAGGAVIAGMARRRIGRLLLVAAGLALLRSAVSLVILRDAGAGQGAWTARGVTGFAAVAVILFLLPVASRSPLTARLVGRWAEGRAPARLALVGLVVGAIGGTLAGHALSRPDPIVAVLFGVTHLTAAAIWTGPLLVLVLATRQSAWGDLDDADRAEETRAALKGIVPVAGWALGAAISTGLLLAVRTWADVDGRFLAALIAKAVIVAAVALPLGVWHHRTRDRWTGVPRTARIEAAGLVVALVLGAVLVGWDPGWTGGSTALDPAVAAVLDGTADDPAICAELEVGRAACYRSTLSTMLASQGPQAAIDAIVALQETDTFVAANCHQVTHDLGNDAAEQISDMADALSVEGSACWSGYYHGFIEARLAGVEDADLAERLPSICDGAAEVRYSFTHYNCLHGLGHGLMLRVDADLFEALPLCRALEEDFWAFRSCASGAFMENVMAAQAGLDVPGVAVDDLLYPCNDVESDLAEDCYMMQTSTILWRLNGDVSTAFEWCDQVEDPHRATCYRSMGRDISARAALDPAGVIDLCRLGAADMGQWCIDGASSNAVYETADRERADALCAAVPPEWLDACVAARDQAVNTVALG